MEDKRIKILSMIAADMESDAKHFDGKEFNGKNVKAYFDNQGAAIAALAGIIETILDGTPPEFYRSPDAKP